MENNITSDISKSFQKHPKLLEYFRCRKSIKISSHAI